MANNKVCVAAVLDSESEMKIIDIQKALGRREFSAHITLGVYENINDDKIIGWTEKFAVKARRIGIYYAGIGIMEAPFIYAMPRMSDELSRMHRDYHMHFDEYSTKWTSLSDNIWTPHTTLGMYSVESVDIAVKMFRIIEGELIGLKVVNCIENKYEVIYTSRFKGNS